MNASDERNIEDNLVLQLDHHLDGLKTKIQNDFSKKSLESEIKKLKGDPIYPRFCLDCEEYALIRFMGRMSVSIGRRLGEIYDKIPRLIASSAFNIPIEKIAPKFGKLELDTCLPFDAVSPEDKEHIIKVVKKYSKLDSNKGVGIEIRYNFNPNDSARLRKDVDMVNYLKKADLTPIYLIFSSISPRQDAIGRLERAGWYFIIGEDASNFSKDLYNIDLSKILQKEKICNGIRRKIDEITKELYTSHAFRMLAEKYRN